MHQQLAHSSCCRRLPNMSDVSTRQSQRSNVATNEDVPVCFSVSSRNCRYEMRLLFFVMLVALHTRIILCRAFTVRQQGMNAKEAMFFSWRTCTGTTCTVRLLSAQKSSEEPIEVFDTNATTSSANQSTLQRTGHASYSTVLLQHSTEKEVLLFTVAKPPALDTNSTVSFGDVVRMSTRLSSLSDSIATPSEIFKTETASFGDVVSLRKSTPSVMSVAIPTSNVVGATISEEREVANRIRSRNTIVAILSIILAAGNFMYQYLHPIEPIQILFDLQQSSAEVSVVGKNHKPTVIDVWAPWCENCKLSAATLQSIEKQYGNDVNFILINGDLPTSWPYIEALGVDAIPHMSMISYDGVVETTLIGPIPKHIIQDDIDVLLLNCRNNAEALSTARSDFMMRKAVDHLELPHKMLDVFAGKPDSTRRVEF
jgi:thiol-disulfide isomerase/thioredoxin